MEFPVNLHWVYNIHGCFAVPSWQNVNYVCSETPSGNSVMATFWRDFFELQYFVNQNPKHNSQEPCEKNKGKKKTDPTAKLCTDLALGTLDYCLLQLTLYRPR